MPNAAPSKKKKKKHAAGTMPAVAISSATGIRTLAVDIGGSGVKTMLLDEAGKPNIGPFECGGTLTIHSKTKEITRSGQYWALAHYSRVIRRGARRIESASVLPGLSHVAAANPDGSYAVVLTHAGASRRVTVRLSGMEAEVQLPSDSITSLTWQP